MPALTGRNASSRWHRVAQASILACVCRRSPHSSGCAHGGIGEIFLDTEQQVASLVGSVLNLGERAGELRLDSPLLGAIPELDSMAVVLLLTAIEKKFGFSIDDDEVDGTTFATLGHLVAFVSRKRGQ